MTVHEIINMNASKAKAKIPLVRNANLTTVNDIKGPVYFPPARGVCYSAAAMRMKGFSVRQTIRIRTDRS